MATSGSIDLTYQGSDIIQEALELLGVLNEGDSPSAAQTASALRTLNMMVKAWQAEGTNLWAIEKDTLFLEKNKNTYELYSSGDRFTASFAQTTTTAAANTGDSTITVDSITGISDGDAIGVQLEDGTLQWTTVNGAPSGSTITLTASLTDDVESSAVVYAYTSKANRPMKILEAARTTKDNIDIPIIEYTLPEYVDLSDKTTDGAINVYYQDIQRQSIKLSVWPESDSETDRLTLWVQRTLDDIDDASTDDLDYPQEWYLALAWNLAVLIAPKYGLTRAEKQELTIMAQYYKDLAEGWDRENFVYMTPDDQYYRD